MKNIILIGLFFCFYSQAQLIDNIKDTNPSLLKAANSIVLSHDVQIHIEKYDKMKISETKEVLVLNQKGLNDVDAFEFYDKVTKIKNLDAVIYNSNGKEIKKIKKKDFKDVSAVSGSTMYSDNRVMYLDYTPTDYPIKISFSSEIETSNTAFIRPFQPVVNYNQSIKTYTYTITNNSDSQLRWHKSEYVTDEVSENSSKNQHSFSIQNIEAYAYEPYSPSLRNMSPKIMFALEKFELEGVIGEATDWESFGNWQNENLLKGVNDLPKATVKAIQQKVEEFETVEEKARYIYEYVQNNTRYISLQIGIGGWKPMTAGFVDKTQYGDCKALTNYTKSLLEVVGIESEYCVVQAGKEISDIEPEFASMQGNHVILHIPQENEPGFWLECTSQKIPFNFLGDFTDNRYVLAVSNNGSKIKKTPAYIEEDNYLFTHAKIDVNGQDLDAELTIKSKGTQYSEHYYLADSDKTQIEKHYNTYWSHLKRLDLVNYQFTNNKQSVEFIEQLQLTVSNYVQQYGNDLIFEVNPFNKAKFNLSTIRERKNPFVISRGFVDKDVFEFQLNEIQVGALPKDVSLETKFGVYQLNFSLENNVFTVKRYLKINRNSYEKSDYSEFVNFVNQIQNYDETKVSFTAI